MIRTPVLLAGLAAAALPFVLTPRAARAQIPEVRPDGSLSEPAAPPPAAPPTPIVITPQGQPGQPAQPAQPGETPAPGVGPGGSGYYHVDENGFAEEEPADVATPGAVPGVHVVRAGDTLWDLCWSYFNNPWEWPRVWSYNPEITNPHWIYPGDQLRLRPAGQEPADKTERPATRPTRPTPTRSAAGFFALRQLAFLAREDLALGIVVDGSPEEKLMLASGDEVYLTYPSGKPPRVGQKYAVYLERERVEHPVTGDDIGAYVRIVGELEVISAAPDKRARAVLTDTVDAVERGMRVGPVERQFRQVEPTAAEVDLEGYIVAEIGSEELIGARQVVVLDRGARDRVKVGNRLHVIRRGDAYADRMGPYSNIGKNDQRYPARSVGEILVVQTGEHSAVALVVSSDRELGVGDRVLLKRGRTRSRAR